MTNLQAALGVAQLEELPEFIRRKRENYIYYKRLFAGNDFVRLLEFRNGTESNQWFYSLEINRDKIKATMREKLLQHWIVMVYKRELLWGTCK